jgi:hypothetical protein
MHGMEAEGLSVLRGLCYVKKGQGLGNARTPSIERVS